MEDNDFTNILKKRYNVEISKKPDYLFYSVFGNEHLKYDGIRIFYTGECVTPNFNECDYAIGFDHLHFGDRYIRIPIYQLFQYQSEYADLLRQRSFTKEDLAKKTGFCSFVYSNCFANPERASFFEMLNQYKTVSSGGRYMNNIGYRVQDKRVFQEKHKFAIAFENTSYPGYTTEKLVDAFAAKTIPIYYGNPQVASDFNPESFIDAHQYVSFEEVLERIREIDNDDEEYLRIINEPPILKHKDTGIEKFLYHIIDQPVTEAFRRPKSLWSIRQEEMILRHNGFEKNIYKYYGKLKRGLYRVKNGMPVSYQANFRKSKKDKRKNVRRDIK